MRLWAIGRQTSFVGRLRLDDIRRDLAFGDFTIRRAFDPESEPILEELAQNLIAGELEQRSREQYKVVRESEIADKARPDIRIFNQGCGGPITIEVKIAERWCMDDLCKAIEEQLIGTYMRANNSAFGIYLVCSSGPKQGPIVFLTFEECLMELRSHAEQVRSKYPGVRGLEVIGIDFHAPASTNYKQSKGAASKKPARSNRVNDKRRPPK